MRVKHLNENEMGQVDLFTPNYLWLTYDSEYGSHFGRSVLLRAWEPWKQKNLDGGAVQLVKQFYHKHSMLGIKGRYPRGETIKTPDGNQTSGRDVMREIVDLSQRGTVYTLPSDTDPQSGKYLYDIEPPISITGDGAGLLEWVDSIDWQIFRGIVIPKEIVEGESGLGQGGRSFPMAVYLTARDVELSTYVREINEQVLYPMAVANFGHDRADYDIEPVSLLQTVSKLLGDMPNSGSVGQGDRRTMMTRLTPVTALGAILSPPRKTTPTDINSAQKPLARVLADAG